MDDFQHECVTASQSSLRELQHMGVTAKLQSPLQEVKLSYSSAMDSESNLILYQNSRHNISKHNTLPNEATNGMDTTITEGSKVLYEMKPVSEELKRKVGSKLAPSKIEFQLYTKSKKCLFKNKGVNSSHNKKRYHAEFSDKTSNLNCKGNSLLQRLKNSFSKMKAAQKSGEENIFINLPEPETFNKTSNEFRTGIYPFEHGCTEYLSTHDCPPRVQSLVWAEKATLYATRFWAEFFGSLQISIIFIVIFLLQCYRFVLYSIVNMLFLEFLNFTSDYLIKPLLTVIFNGFLQPPLIFCFNTLSSLRDTFKPIADTFNNFMKPVATVGRSLRLVNVTYNKDNTSENV